MAIRCGNHRRSDGEPVYHENIASVKACSRGENVASVNPDAVEPSGSLDNNPPKIREITEGMWYLGERIVKVQVAHHGSGRLYTKTLVRDEPSRSDSGWHFEMLRGGMQRLRTSEKVRKMTLEEAMQFGKLYGFCCRCGTILTNEESIEAGIGPVCAGKF